MVSMDEKAVKAKNDDTYLALFIQENESFIIGQASKNAGKFITKSDDQWSISLSAFHEAIKTYSEQKGHFYAFAQLVIKRRFIDFTKKESKHYCEISIDPYSFESGADEEDDDSQVKREVVAKLVTTQSDGSKMEIEAISKLLNEYGFTFYDLISVSPKAKKTKVVCAKAISYIVKNNELIIQMRKTKFLPLKIIEQNLKLPRKILE
ncbi:MAG: polymerase, sigma 28 subunit, FliA/WhiG subfamily, partial [Oscillospiraceae bacterium]|nr:polymerase, sigma 28 subunit, FliA/WhiG subfamily [Oscillospiraceae bacterium]